MAASLVPVDNVHSDQGNSPDLTLKQSVTLLECLESCWREDVAVLSCADKFLRLSLQLLSRSVYSRAWILCSSLYPCFITDDIFVNVS